MDEHAQIIQNQKAIAAALEYLIWKDWGPHMSPPVYEMMNALRAMNGKPELLGTPKKVE